MGARIKVNGKVVAGGYYNSDSIVKPETQKEEHRRTFNGVIRANIRVNGKAVAGTDVGREVGVNPMEEVSTDILEIPTIQEDHDIPVTEVIHNDKPELEIKTTIDKEAESHHSNFQNVTPFIRVDSQYNEDIPEIEETVNSTAAPVVDTAPVSPIEAVTPPKSSHVEEDFPPSQWKPKTDAPSRFSPQSVQRADTPSRFSPGSIQHAAEPSRNGTMQAPADEEINITSRTKNLHQFGGFLGGD